jgi:hypothetical protein
MAKIAYSPLVHGAKYKAGNMYNDRKAERPNAVAYSHPIGVHSSSWRLARSSCQNNNPEETIVSPNTAPSKTSKNLREVSAGTTQERIASSATSVALDQNKTFITTRAYRIHAPPLVEVPRASSLIAAPFCPGRSSSPHATIVA